MTNSITDTDNLNFGGKPIRNNFFETKSFSTGFKIDSAWGGNSNEGEKQFLKNNKADISVFDCAAYIISKYGSITTMKLHKLLYYSQAWSLVWDDQPLFSDRIEAWANGPVIPTLFKYHRGRYSLANVSIGNPHLLIEKQKETIDSILKYYGDKSTQWLIDLTHLEEPWKLARKDLLPQQRGNSEISLSSMAEYYSAL